MKALLEIQDWKLIDAKDVDVGKVSLIGGQNLVSFMWHVCDALKFEHPDEENTVESEIRYLDPEDSVRGRCWYCMDRAPDELHTMWTIHNMDKIRYIDSDDSWNEKYLEARVKDIKRMKDEAREAGTYNG